MLSVGERAMIRDLLKTGMAADEVARRTGRSISTVYNYQRLTKNGMGEKPHEDSAANQTRNHYKPAVRVETGPGEQAQVDWGSFGTVRIHDRKEKLYAFVYILSYSRMMYVEFVVRQNLSTLENCHMNAFEKLGIPKTIRYDNMKTVVLSHKRIKDASPEIKYNPAFLDFARYYGFVAEACPPYWPRAKGKVERSIRYLRDSFIEEANIGREFISLEYLNTQVSGWLEHQSWRTHRTLHQSPQRRYGQELPHLAMVKNVPRYCYSVLQERRSTKDGLVAFNGNLYSVPQYMAGKKCLVREMNKNGVSILEIYHEDEKIAEHVVTSQKGQWVVNSEHSLMGAKSVEADARVAVKSLKQPRNRHDIAVATRPLGYYDQKG